MRELPAQGSSFRDPDGKLHVVGSGVFRTVSASAAPAIHEFLQSATAEALIRSGKLVETWDAADSDAQVFRVRGSGEPGSADVVLQHERVWFASYPYEWPAEMLFVAAELTLEIATDALKEGFCLKDATPYNILFRGPKPVFVDVLSFEKRDPNDPRWLPYAQFVRTFALPLLMNRDSGVRTDEIFLPRPDGLQPEEVYRGLPWLKRIRPPFLTTVSIPTCLTRRVDPDDQKLYTGYRSEPADKAEFVFRMGLRRAGKLLERVKPPQARVSNWSSYLDDFSYSSDEFHAKSTAVERWVGQFKPASVLDAGCNTGHFSEIAARSGAKVVAVDVDPVVVGQSWQRAAHNNLDILPLIVNLARPTPAVGWRNAEYASFLARSEGAFDMALFLAVAHHLLVTERIPLREIVDLCAELTKSYVVIEYVSKDDPMFQRLTRGRAALHENFTQESFEATCQQRFAILEKLPVKKNLRWLYLLQRRD